MTVGRMLAQEQWARLQEELAHVSRVATMGELAGMIAHEVNQPLGAIVSNAQACMRLLDGRAAQVGQIREALQDIVNDGIRATEIIGRVREFVRRGGSKRAPVNINDVAQDVARLLQSRLVKNNIALSFELSDQVGLVSADRIQLQQVILNLLINAAESIEQCPSGPRRIIVSSEHHCSSVILRIQDTGPGFSPEDEPRIFQAFFTTKPKGMGMGLAICRSIIVSHGGCISAERGRDRGATFRMALPAIEGSNRARADRLCHR